MKDNPLISIYMPTWNRQQLAIRAIKSVLRRLQQLGDDHRG